jgi:hypothetical protein
MRGRNVFDPSAVQRLADSRGARKSPVLLPPPAPTPGREEHPYVGSLLWRGLTLLIETAEGEDRSGPGWRVTMPAHYGEVAGTISALDGDPVDVFVGPDLGAPMAFVVHQKHPGTQAIDEDKVVIGVASAADAEALYRSAYTAGGFFHGLTAWPAEELANLLRAGGTIPRLDRPSAIAERLAKAQGETVLVMVDGKQRAGTITGVGGMGLTVDVGGQSVKAAHGTYQWAQVGEELGDDDDSSESVSTSESVSAATWGDGLEFADAPFKLPPGWATMGPAERVDAAADWTVVQAEMARRYPIEIEPGYSIASQAGRYFAEAVTAGWIDQTNAGRATKAVTEVARALAMAQVAPITAAVIIADVAQKILHQEVEAWRARQADRGARHIHAGMMHLAAILDAMEIAAGPRAAALIAWVSHDMAYTLPATRAGALDDALHPRASANLWRAQCAASWAMREAVSALLGDEPVSVPAAWIEGHARLDIEAGDPVASAFRMEGATHLWATKAMEDLAAAETARDCIARLRFLGPSKQGETLAVRLARRLAGAARGLKDCRPQAAAADAWASAESDGWVQPEPGGLQGHLVGMDWSPATRTLTMRVGECPTRDVLDRVFGADEPTAHARKVFGTKASLGLNDKLEVGGEQIRLVILATGDTYQNTPAQAEFARVVEVAEQQWAAVEAIPDRSVSAFAAYGYATVED